MQTADVPDNNHLKHTDSYVLANHRPDQTHSKCPRQPPPQANKQLMDQTTTVLRIQTANVQNNNHRKHTVSYVLGNHRPNHTHSQCPRQPPPQASKQLMGKTTIVLSLQTANVPDNNHLRHTDRYVLANHRPNQTNSKCPRQPPPQANKQLMDQTTTVLRIQTANVQDNNHLKHTDSYVLANHRPNQTNSKCPRQPPPQANKQLMDQTTTVLRIQTANVQDNNHLKHTDSYVLGNHRPNQTNRKCPRQPPPQANKQLMDQTTTVLRMQTANVQDNNHLKHSDSYILGNHRPNQTNSQCPRQPPPKAHKQQISQKKSTSSRQTAYVSGNSRLKHTNS